MEPTAKAGKRIENNVYMLGRRFATTGAKQAALVFITLGIIIVSAYVLYLLVEKPVQKWSSHFKYRRPRDAEETDVTDAARDDADSLALPLPNPGSPAMIAETDS